MYVVIGASLYDADLLAQPEFLSAVRVSVDLRIESSIIWPTGVCYAKPVRKQDMPELYEVRNLRTFVWQSRRGQ